MPKSKTGRTAIRGKLKQAINLNTRILDYLHDVDVQQDGKNERIAVTMPLIASIYVQGGEALTKLYKST